MSIRILVADDFVQWRDFVSSTVKRETEWHIVGEASDGPEAIEKAKDLTPDVILLDIGLPKLGGIEVARQIRKLVPQSKILFLSGMHDPEIVEEAMGTGASGYVFKFETASELKQAIEDILRGEQYLSSSIRGFIPKDTEDSRTPNGPIRKEPFTSSPESDLTQETVTTSCHEVHFYSTDAFLLGRLTHFIGAALMAGNTAIVIATKRHRDTLLRRLREYSVDVDAAIQRGSFVSLDAAETLSMFMVKDRPDAARFLESFGKLIASVSKATRQNILASRFLVKP
jgi:DNA-binding NarL/FixJ family response regulator